MIHFEMDKSAADVTLLCGAARPARGEGDFQKLLKVALDGLIDSYVARRGQLRILPDANRHGLSLVRSHFRTFLPETDLAHGRLSIKKALTSGEPVFQDNHLVDNAGFLSCLCVPIPGDSGPLGWIYLERPGRGSAFSRYQVWQAQWLAQLAAVEVTNGLRRRWRWRFLDVSRLAVNQVA